MFFFRKLIFKHNFWGNVNSSKTHDVEEHWPEQWMPSFLFGVHSPLAARQHEPSNMTHVKASELCGLVPLTLPDGRVINCYRVE